MKAIIFGTGGVYQKYKDCFKNMDIICFIDNDEKKWGKVVDNHNIVSPKTILNMHYDYIFLVSNFFSDMRNQLLGMGIEESKIIDREHKGLFKKLIQTENYTFVSDNKNPKVLMISHTLDLTGAPIAFCKLAHILKNNGYCVTVYSERNCNTQYGHLLYDLLQDEISVKLFVDINEIKYTCVEEKYEFIWINTITLLDIVKSVIPFSKKIFWWLHETEDLYNCIGKNIKYPMSDNLYVLTVGWMARESYERHSGQKVFKDLLYGIDDIKEKVEIDKEKSSTIKCGIIGTYCKRKGQDILFSIIQEHSEWNTKVEFVFVGKMPNHIKERYESCINIKCMGELTPEEISGLYQTLDVLICPSLNDPMPIVVSEAMQHKKMCIVSDRVGQSHYITNEIDGLVCVAGDKESLSDKIDWIIENKNKLKEMGDRSYKIYESNFKYSIFRNNVLSIMENDG